MKTDLENQNVQAKPHCVAALACPATRGKKYKKIAAMYCAMVAVSTIAIFFLEHATLMNAFRTAIVAAVGKTFAANWVSGIFD